MLLLFRGDYPWKNNPIVLVLFHFDGEIFRGNFRIGQGFERGIGCLNVEKLELLESNTVVFFFFFWNCLDFYLN